MNEIIEIPNDKEFYVIEYDYAKYFIDKIYASSMPVELTEKFLQQIENSSKKHNHNLAGEIAKEYSLFSKFDRYNILENDMLENVNNSLSKHIKNIMGEDFKGIDLTSMWVNIQEKTEYNPTHNHDGDFSFVWYLHIPQEIRNEHKNTESTYQSKGLIQFNSMFTNSVLRFNPKKADILIFRSEHYHQVYPFYTDNKRISISGNIKV